MNQRNNSQYYQLKTFMQMMDNNYKQIHSERGEIIFDPTFDTEKIVLKMSSDEEEEDNDDDIKVNQKEFEEMTQYY